MATSHIFTSSMAPSHLFGPDSHLSPRTMLNVPALCAYAAAPSLGTSPTNSPSTHICFLPPSRVETASQTCVQRPTGIVPAGALNLFIPPPASPYSAKIDPASNPRWKMWIPLCPVVQRPTAVCQPPCELALSHAHTEKCAETL